MNMSVSPFINLSNVIADVRKHVGEWGLEVPLVLLLFGRLGRIMAKMERLAKAFQEGKVLRRGPRKEGARRIAKASDAAPQAKAERIWPQPFGWLIIKAGWRAVGFAGQIRATLEQPEMIELLKACPQAVRVLKPLCRMMMIETSLLYPGVPVPEKAPRPPVEKKQRVRKPRPKQDLGRVPIPRGVMSAVRRGRYGKV